MPSKKKHSSTVRCLVTGFGPFGAMVENPSELIATEIYPQVEILGSSSNKVRVKGLVLPTSSKESWEKLKEELKKTSPDILIMVGVAGGRTEIQFERFGLNIRDYPIADISDYKPVGEKISKRGPAAYETQVSLSELQKYMSEHGVEAKISNHAGAYVCNDLFYRALKYQQKHRELKVVQFIHVPELSDPLNSEKRLLGAGTRACQLKGMCDAVAKVAGFLASTL